VRSAAMLGFQRHNGNDDTMNTISNAAYEGDIVSRLRNWRGLHLAHSGQLFEEAADEIERLHGYRNEAEAAASIAGLVAERLRLTDEEREAIEVAAKWCEEPIDQIHSKTSLDAMCAADVLRGLLDRMK